VSTEPVEELPPGVWAAFNYDGSACVVFATELEALRYAMPYSMPVHYVPFGNDAISGKKP
jgi:hypothetical protein